MFLARIPRSHPSRGPSRPRRSRSPQEHDPAPHRDLRRAVPRADIVARGRIGETSCIVRPIKGPSVNLGVDVGWGTWTGNPGCGGFKVRRRPGGGVGEGPQSGRWTHADRHRASLRQATRVGGAVVVEGRGNLLKETVTGRMALPVVDSLEPVQVEEQQGDLPVDPAGAPHRVVQPIAEERAVGQIGERVVLREVLQPRFVLLAGRDVPERRDVMADRPAFAAGRRDRQILGEDLPALAPVPDLALPEAVGENRLPHLPVELRGVTSG